jgi:hypothetical protein
MGEIVQCTCKKCHAYFTELICGADGMWNENKKVGNCGKRIKYLPMLINNKIMYLLRTMQERSMLNKFRAFQLPL